MTSSKVTTEARNHILLMGLNRTEKLNAFDLEMYRELSLAYGELDRNPEHRCGVLFAHGDHFTSGLDLMEWASAFAGGSFPNLPENGVDPLGLQEDKLVNKPVVMAAQGICFTIGLELLLATDIRVAAKNTRFCQLEIKRGIYPVGGATVRLMHEIGWGNAMRYLLTADEISAEDAYRMGLVQEITEPGKQLEHAVAIAETVAKQAPLAVKATLTSARLARAQGERPAFDRLLSDLVPLMSTEDVREGLQSFIERREAVFKGK